MTQRAINYKRNFSCDLPRPEKTCGIVRLGALGDMLIASTIFTWLKDHDFHITLYASDMGYEVVKHDPRIDRFIIQGANEVPPQALGRFYEHEAQKYDKFINLSESVEGTLLAVPGSAAHEWPNEVRAKYMDRNYLEFTHEIAGVPPPYLPKFYSTPDEREWARFEKRKMGRRNILWSLSGSSVHKHWPHMDKVILGLLGSYDDVDVVLVGDDMCKVLEAGWVKMVDGDFTDSSKRVHCRSGKWTIRQSMAFAEVADLIIGTETGLLNAAGSMDTPKIVMLSHSSEEMLTKHWTNVTALSQTQGTGCPIQPCRILHYSWQHCRRHESGDASECMWNIPADVVMSAAVNVLGEPKRRMVA